MTKQNSIYTTVAESIMDFSTHKINRLELYEIICNCILVSTNEDKSIILEKNDLISTPYQTAKGWITRK